MTSYNFTFANKLTSPDAFYFTISQNFQYIDTSQYFSYTSDNTTGLITGATIYTTISLSTDELTTLTNLVNNYVEPIYYFPGKWGIINNPTRSTSTNDITPNLVFTWIYPGQLSVLGGQTKGPGGVINEIKTLVQYDIDDITTASAITNPTVTIEIFDSTRNYSVVTEVIDASSVVSGWVTKAQNGATGTASTTNSMMFYDMWGHFPNYDVILNFIVTVSDPKITVTLNTLQYICYNQPVYLNPANNPNP